MAFRFSFNVLPKKTCLPKLMFVTSQKRCKQVQSHQTTCILQFVVICYYFLLFVSYPTLSYPILSYPILPYPTLPYPILPYPILPYPILSYPILPYPTLSYPTLSYPLSSTSPVLGPYSFRARTTVSWSVQFLGRTV